MSSKSPSQIKVGDLVQCVATFDELRIMGIVDVPLSGKIGVVKRQAKGGWIDVEFGFQTWMLKEDFVESRLLIEEAEEVEDVVCTQIKKRRDAGRAKYGTTMERTDLSILPWVQHAQEEAMDFSIYLEKLKRELKAKGIE